MLRKKRRKNSNAAEAGEIVILKSREYTTSDNVIAFLKSVKNKKNRYFTQAKILKVIKNYHDRAGDMIEEVYKYIKTDGIFRTVFSREKFEKT